MASGVETATTPPGRPGDARPPGAPEPSRRRLRRRPRAPFSRSALGMLPYGAYLLVVLGFPGVVLVLYSVWKPAFFTVVREFTLENYTAIVESATYFDLLLKSLAIGLLVAALLTACAFLIAYAITFRFGRWGTRVLIAIVASMLASYLVRIYAWKTIFGTRGLINEGLIGIGVIDEPLRFLLYGPFAIVITMIYVYLPLAVLPIYAGLQDIDRRMLEAARDLGSPPGRVFRQVTLPLVLPAVRTAFVLSFILAASDYVTPAFVGGTDGQMLGQIIYSQFGAGSNFPQGSALSIALIAGIAVVYGALRLLGALVRVGATHVPRRPPRRATVGPPGRVRTHLARIPAIEIATGALLLFLAAPLIVVILFSFNDSTVPGLPFRGFTAHWWTDTFAVAEFRRALRTSVEVAVLSVAIGLLIGVPAAYALVRAQRRARAVYEGLVYVPAAVPGVVFGVAVLMSAVLLEIRLGVAVTVVAHALLVSPFIVLVVRARLATMDPRLQEAARDLGSRRRRVLATIDLPLVAPSLLGASILAAAISLDNVVVTNFTIGASTTVPTYLFSGLRSDSTPALNVIAVTMLVVPLLLVALVLVLLRGRGSRRPR